MLLWVRIGLILSHSGLGHVSSVHALRDDSASDASVSDLFRVPCRLEDAPPKIVKAFEMWASLVIAKAFEMWAPLVIVKAFEMWAPLGHLGLGSRAKH